MHFTTWILQDIKPHVVSHGILNKLSSLLHLYSIFNNKAKKYKEIVTLKCFSSNISVKAIGTETLTFP